MLDFIGVDPAMLPELLSSSVEIGSYNGIRIVTGAIDQIAGAIGAGVVKSGIVSEMTGTTMVLPATLFIKKPFLIFIKSPQISYI